MNTQKYHDIYFKFIKNYHTKIDINYKYLLF